MGAKEKRVAQRVSTTLYLVWGRLILPSEEIRGLVYLLSEQSSAHRTGGFREMRCDRGTNFIGAEAELKKAVKEMYDQKIKAELLKESIDWIKNSASASNFGGVCERQIRSIRNVMNGLIRKHGNRLDEESLRTSLCEAEYTITNRPLEVETLNDPSRYHHYH